MSSDASDTQVIEALTERLDAAAPDVDEGPDDGESLVAMMRSEPGALVRIVGEWALVTLVVAACASIVFLLVLGGYVLVAKAP